MRTLAIILSILVNYSYGQLNEKKIYGKWVLINFDIDNVPVFDKKNPINVVNKSMEVLRIIKPDYNTIDSIEYIHQITTQSSSFTNYSMEFLKNGTYRNTKMSRGQVTNEKENGKFKIIKSTQTLIQIDDKQRKTESRIELNANILRLFIQVGGKDMIMTFEKT
jgi:hypothetical protein